LGGLSSLKAHELGAKVIGEALQRANLAPDDVSEVILGQVNYVFISNFKHIHSVH